MRNRASHVFATANVNYCKGVARNKIYTLMTSIDKSLNPIIHNIAISDLYCTSKLRIQGITSLHI